MGWHGSFVTGGLGDVGKGKETGGKLVFMFLSIY